MSKVFVLFVFLRDRVIDRKISFALANNQNDHALDTFFIHMSINFHSYEYHMDLVMGHVHRAGQPTFLHGKTFDGGHYMQTVQQIFFIPAMLIGTISLYHFIPLSLTLALPGGHKVSTKHNLLASFSPALFI